MPAELKFYVPVRLSEASLAALAGSDQDVANRLAELEVALRNIADPIAHFSERAKAEGARLNTPQALLLANDPSYLKQIAREALEQKS